MAIWQYPFQAVPQKDIKNELGELPSHLKIEEEGEWINVVDTSRFWQNSTLNAKPIITSIDKLLPKEAWSNSTESSGWKGDTENQEDNDCWLGYKGDFVTSFSFRVDMRDLKNLDTFLMPMLEICKLNDLILVCEGEKVVKPELEEVKPMLIESRAVSFVQDPKGFIEDFSKNKKNLENKKGNEMKEIDNPSFLKRIWKKWST